QLIRDALQEYDIRSDVIIIKHLERSEYINCLANADLMLGNSSSGIIEAASFNLLVVNIGSRQNLREYGDNVIHSSASYESVFANINEVLERPKKAYKNIYGDGKASERCYQLLKTITLDTQILNKSNAY
ncbi:UDP-N-acetylglucosamine 2-epimerase, partial [uncultured Legionella sp.]|uniref:UDP-N-acetylglucosamine 2-epimerase n=1 Tax=uncultured Legionella sp. TaxID=210934 RepID=UPI00261E23E1